MLTLLILGAIGAGVAASQKKTAQAVGALPRFMPFARSSMPAAPRVPRFTSVKNIMPQVKKQPLIPSGGIVRVGVMSKMPQVFVPPQFTTPMMPMAPSGKPFYASSAAGCPKGWGFVSAGRSSHCTPPGAGGGSKWAGLLRRAGFSTMPVAQPGGTQIRIDKLGAFPCRTIE